MPEASDHSGPRFAILASGRGSNACALMDSFTSGMNRGCVAVVITNRPQAQVLDHATQRDIPTVTLDHKDYARPDHEKAILAALEAHKADHILLAGYMRILSADFLEAFLEKLSHTLFR